MDHKKWMSTVESLLKANDGVNIKEASAPALYRAFAEIKHLKKAQLSEYVYKNEGVLLPPEFIFDVQAKRLHEYKRQLLNAFSILYYYFRIKEGKEPDFKPTAFIFGAKAAPGYLLAKQIIQMIYTLSKVIEADPVVRDKIKIFFLEDYRVTMAELMIPSADISEQISLASTEASGTGNMKLMMNGAITLGTEDGANVEIHKAVGDDNIIIFGMQTPEVLSLQKTGYNPAEYYNNNAVLREALEFIGQGFGGRRFDDIYNTLKNHDTYMAMADFADYKKAQAKASELYSDPTTWNRMSLVNIAKSGIFSADRSIEDYARDIWGLTSLK